ncbi:MAG: (2Fe-2S)-binding protein [Woeseiaceae bacterium]
MYVCICNAVTESQIRDAADAGVSDLWALQAKLGVATNCGSCKETASAILSEKRRARRVSQPRMYIPSHA